MRRLWSADKPYFDLEGDNARAAQRAGAAALRRPSTLTFWQRTLGYSYRLRLRACGGSTCCTTGSATISASTRPAPASASPACSPRASPSCRSSSGAPVLRGRRLRSGGGDDPAFAAEQRRMTAGLLDCAAKQRPRHARQLRRPGRHAAAARPLRAVAHERRRQCADRAADRRRAWRPTGQ